MIRTGLGVDAHGFTAGDGFMLGGVHIPHDKSIAGHSDGDVVLHAIVDALLGAVARGDIGTHFPSSDPQWRGASSRIFLQRAREIVAEANGEICHVDCTVILQEPAIGPYIPDMRRLIADDLAVELDQVSIKATTTDHLGFIGRGEGIAAIAVATVKVSGE
ncbi:MAG: 2-C-methyl-D-erythritol 2,4-cyclodiphosphate synthase [Candidatus Neomarinimicrobiota bacterium]